MSKAIPIQADPQLARETITTVEARVRALRERGSRGPVEITFREASVMTATMNDMNAGSDRGMAFEPEIGDEGSVFGHPFVVVPVTDERVRDV